MPERYELAYLNWQRLANKGYSERCVTPAQMQATDLRIRKAKERYEKLLQEFKSKQPS